MTDFDDMLNFDALDVAQEITGKSYKDDEATSSLGMALHMLHNENMRDELALRDDTHYHISFADTVRILIDLGFEEVYSREYAGSGVTETQSFFWRQGVLAVMTSYNAVTLNSGKIYYNWEPKEGTNAWEFTSSGGLDLDSHNAGRYVWVGNHDLREALRHNMDRLESNGTFLSSWVDKPFLWFLTHPEEKSEVSSTVINASVEAELPAFVVDAMNGVGAE